MITHSRAYKIRKPLPLRLEGAAVANSDNKTEETGKQVTSNRSQLQRSTAANKSMAMQGTGKKNKYLLLSVSLHPSVFFQCLPLAKSNQKPKSKGV